MDEKKRYEVLFRYVTDVVVVMDSNGKILDANDKARAVFGKGILGANVDALGHGISERFDSAGTTQVVQSFHIRDTKTSRRNLFLRANLVPVESNGRVDEVVLIGRDCMEIEPYREEVDRLREQLKALRGEKKPSEKSKGKSASSLAAALRKLEVANQKLGDMYKTLNGELELAATLQKSLIPEPPAQDGRLRFAFHYEPMGHVGGDYYDVVDIDDSKKGVFLADVSGHGVSSAFIAAMLKISFRNYAPGCGSPAKVLKRLNREYCNVIQTGDYVTAFYAVFDTSNNSIVYSGAGHPRPICRHRKKNISFLSSEGFFIGMFEDADYDDSVIDFVEGDRFLAYTDGIIEAYSSQKNEQFGEKRLLESFGMHDGRSLPVMLQRIIEDVKRFMHKSSFYDDLAMIAVEYKRQRDKR
ncbi:MAG: SpoIIE family protein phosphatase [Spirochaetes bacterium]|nr:SpoIIE family protein phosphatase [Spirochaetota bacterium]